MIDKIFDPASFEQRWYAHWEHNARFRPSRPDAKPFTIVIPPPNVTGSLHIGHALDNTLQDLLIRWHRLNGRDARWIVGTDHAGIATQMLVPHHPHPHLTLPMVDVIEEARKVRPAQSESSFVLF